MRSGEFEVMGLVSSGLKPICEGMIRNLQSVTNAMQSLGTVRADVKLVSDQGSEAKIRNYTIISDEPKTSGGGDRGPSPLDYFMASIGFCENVTFARHAALLGLDFDSLETSVRGHWDRKGQFELDGTEPSFRDIIVETKIVSQDPVEKIIEVVRLTHRRCSMHATISKAAHVTDKLIVNGQEAFL